jgi:pentapeptide MXKDX repeat protein
VAKLVEAGQQFPSFDDGRPGPSGNCPSWGRIFQSRRNKRDFRAVHITAAHVAIETGFKKDEQSMTIRTRIALGISAAVVSLSVAFAPVAFAADDMKKDDGMKKDAMSKDGMKKDDGMMKKDDGMKKDTMSKDGMKKDK